MGHVAPGTAPRVRTTPTTRDLVSYCGGRNRLLPIAGGAEVLAVAAWAVYHYFESGELPHVRMTNSIRIRPSDLQAFIASRLGRPML